jgi:hypothetical protein
VNENLRVEGRVREGERERASELWWDLKKGEGEGRASVLCSGRRRENKRRERKGGALG